MGSVGPGIKYVMVEVTVLLGSGKIAVTVTMVEFVVIPSPVVGMSVMVCVTVEVVVVRGTGGYV